MDYLAMRERSVAKLAQWKLSDPRALPLHADNAQYHSQVWDPDIAPGVVLERRRALERQDVPRVDVDLDA